MWLVFPQVALAGILPLCQGLKQELNAAVNDGFGGGRAFNPHSFVFFAQCLLRPKKMPGLLIISVLNGLFKTRQSQGLRDKSH